MIRTAIHLVRPEGVDDPERPSGGNVYDRRIADGLGAVEHTSLETVPDGALVIVDAFGAYQVDRRADHSARS